MPAPPRLLVLLALLSVGLSACSTAPTRDMPPASPAPIPLGGNDDLRLSEPPVADISQVRIPMFRADRDSREMTELRRSALMEAAQGHGSQLGFARRAWEIGRRLEEKSGQLSQVFDFSRVASEAPAGAGHVLPPVVSRSFDAFEGDPEGREASVAEEYLTIVRAGQIRPVLPTWRDYLIFIAPSPEDPPRSLLPQDVRERELFEEWMREGWEAGKLLAEAELEHRLDRLVRDYNGMLQYRRLVSLGMMDRMVLQDADFGVTVEDGQMRIGSRTVRIVSDADFQKDPRRWRVRPVSERDRQIVETGVIPPLGLLD